MKKKLKLNDLKVQSFVTELDINKSKEIKTGAKTNDVAGCGSKTCGIIACSVNIINCII